jgi:hypothetical protein
LNVYVVIKEDRNVLLMLMNYKYVQVTYFMQKIITFPHTVDNQYAVNWGCLIKVKSQNRK